MSAAFEMQKIGSSLRDIALKHTKKTAHVRAPSFDSTENLILANRSRIDWDVRLLHSQFSYPRGKAFFEARLRVTMRFFAKWQKVQLHDA